jgi:hypothetical protein
MATRNWNSSEKRKLKGCFIMTKLRKTVLLSNEKNAKKDLKSLEKGKKNTKAAIRRLIISYIFVFILNSNKNTIYTPFGEQK